MLLENPCIFLLANEKAWKCIFNTNSELSQNHTEKQIIPAKTTINWLFNDIWSYLFIACLIEKLDFSYIINQIQPNQPNIVIKEVDKREAVTVLIKIILGQ